ncbi:class I SAM-dependent methyltransferase [Candidatus Babeliales bacterium]|nr:class I SAM-dependent methyltransferase [Candidatus Babeliales bacterium]
MEYFDKAYSGAVDVQYFTDEQAIIKRNHDRFDMISTLPSPNKTILDFGAGVGYFVRECVENDWFVVGVEQSEAAMHRAWYRLGVFLFADMWLFKDDRFNIITLWDVIEHLEDPKATLTMLKEYLAPGGYIVIETANINSLDFHTKRKRWSFWLMDHYYYYSDKTLKTLLRSIGFTIVDVIDPAKKPKTLKRFFRPLTGLKGFYYKRKYQTASNDPIMIVVAKK